VAADPGRVPFRYAALAAFAAVIWGVNFVVIDAGLAGTPPLLFAALRFTAVAVPAVLLVRRPAARMRDVALVGILMSLGQFGLLYTALHLGMPPGLASLVIQAQVLFTVAVAAARLGERPAPRQLAGIAVGVTGLAVVAAGTGGTARVLAVALTLAAALSWACGNVVARSLGPVSGLSLTVWAATVAPVPLLGLSLLLDGPHADAHALAHLGVRALLSTAYTAYLSSLAGYGIWNSLLGRFPAAAVTPYSLLVPPVAIAAAWVAYGEAPAVTEWAGGLLMLGGVAITALSRRPGPAPGPRARGPLAPGPPGQGEAPPALWAGRQETRPARGQDGGVPGHQTGFPPPPAGAAKFALAVNAI
jgi:O-acetylserine/cysteine efflux transporter